MKKVLLTIVFVLTLALIFTVGVVCADTIALKATWTPNTDTVTTGYKIYRTDGTRILLGTIPGKTTSSYLFNITVPAGAVGTATFIMTSTSATKEGADSPQASYPFDLSPDPMTVVGFGVTKQ